MKQEPCCINRGGGCFRDEERGLFPKNKKRPHTFFKMWTVSLYSKMKVFSKPP